jgi:D-beta-D-heptose 7-phosphate kinase/D-beta-D-heptose 1-phosphate adenosyltransferase
VIGESCKDIYHTGVVDRISSEAPVPIFKSEECFEKFGMAKNVHLNVLELNQECDIITNNDTHIRKERFIDKRFDSQVFRLDINDICNPLDIDILNYSNLSSYDAIIVSDYNKGFITPEVAEFISRSNDCIFVDSKKKDLSCYDGCFLKINEKEKSELIKPVDPEKLIVTSGKKGAFYLGNMYPAIQSEVFDVCGAGDVFIACLSTFYLHTNDIIKSIKLSNAFSSVSVRFSGNYIIKMNEVLNALQN